MTTTAVENLGEKGTVVDVSKGYLRNFLIPRRLAQPATRGLLEQAKAPNRQLAGSGRKRAVFHRVGRKLVEDEPKGDGRLGIHGNVQSFHGDASAG